MQLTPPDSERKKKIEEIKRQNPNINFSKEFYERVVDKLHKELYGENEIEKLKTLIQEADKKIDEANKQVKEEIKEKELIIEKLKKAEKEEPERKKIEEKRKEREIRQYDTRYYNEVRYLLKNFELNNKEAEDLVKDHLSSIEFTNQKMGIAEFAIKDGYKLNRDSLEHAKNNKDFYIEMIEYGYKFV